MRSVNNVRQQRERPGREDLRKRSSSKIGTWGGARIWNTETVAMATPVLFICIKSKVGQNFVFEGSEKTNTAFKVHS